MPVLIKPTNLNYLLLKIILDHMNLENIWVSFCISESILDLYQFAFQVNKAHYKLILAIPLQVEKNHKFTTYIHRHI